MVIPIGQTTCHRARLPTDETHIVSYWSTEKGKGDLKGKLNPPSTIAYLRKLSKAKYGGLPSMGSHRVGHN